VLVLLLLAAGSPEARQAPLADRELDHVAAFARLYGVVRYFFPSDAAAELDWQQFAIVGVTRVRRAENVTALRSTLEQLFRPLGPGIEIGTKPRSPAVGEPDTRLVAWRYLGPSLESATANPYRRKRTNRAAAAGSAIDGFVTVMQTVPADAFRGRTIRLRGRVRAAATDPSGGAALWLRVDRGDAGMGFFDNMANRPIRDAEWRTYSIEGDVAGDATAIAFGVMASGGVAADFDDISLDAGDPNAADRWGPIPIKDAGFELGSTVGAGWHRAGSSATAEVARLRDGAPEGKQFLRLGPPSSTPPDANELFEDVPPRTGDYADVDLGLGLAARVPLSLTDADARAGQRPHAPAVGAPADAALNTRLADVVVAWNVFRHFYPYWTEAAVDWDARLRPQLAGAGRASSREEHRNALRRLVADARDGHGGVIDVREARPQAFLPIRLRALAGDAVVIASDASEVPVGAVILSIDGVDARARLTELAALASGTPQWKQVRAVQELTMCAPGAPVSIVFDDGSGRRPATLTCRAQQPSHEKRPDPVGRLEDGIWYVDLTRAKFQQIQAAMSSLKTAAAVVFDVRGYPTDAGARMLPYLIDGAENDRWMHVAKVVGPFGRIAGWQSVGWNVQPSPERLAAKSIFLTDARAISYAESVMGYIGDRKLAAIVGSTTAGTNGNVTVFTVPGGFRIAFTGMRVTRHDGRSSFHLAGVKPDVEVEPTIAGIRAGRDEVLERAVALVRQ
jgi:hypothetical protein